MKYKFFKKIFERGGRNMNLINFTHIYVPKSTLKWMITFVIITTIVNMMIHQIKKLKKNKKK